MLVWGIIIGVCYFIYFVITFIWMRYTFKFNTLNRYAFKRSIEKNDFMMYIEMAFVILLLMGLLTTIISQIQILFIKRKNNE